MGPGTPPASETTQSTPQAFEGSGEVDTHIEEVANPIQINDPPPHSEPAIGRSITTFASTSRAPPDAEASAEPLAPVQALNTSPATNRMPPPRRGGRARQPTKRKADSEAVGRVGKQGRPARKA